MRLTSSIQGTGPHTLRNRASHEGSWCSGISLGPICSSLFCASVFDNPGSMGLSRNCGLFILLAVSCKYTNIVYHFVDDVHEWILSEIWSTALDVTVLLRGAFSAWTARMWGLM